MLKTKNLALTGVTLLILAPLAAPSYADSKTGGGYASEVPADEVLDNSKGTVLASDSGKDTIGVANEIDFVVDSDFRQGAASDDALKAIAAIDYFGTRYVSCEQYPLEVHDSRSNPSRKLIKTENSGAFEIAWNDKSVTVQGDPQGLSLDNERALLATFSFDNPVIELRKDRHALRPLGVEKVAGVLTWKLQLDRPGDYHRVLYMDTHTGDIIKSSIVDATGKVLLDVLQHDFRTVDGIRVPFAVDYKDKDGTMLASDRINRVEVKRTTT